MLYTHFYYYFIVLANYRQSKQRLLRGHIKASGKLGLCRLVSFGIHLSLHIEPGRVDRVEATHISKQQLSLTPQSHVNMSTPVNTM